MGPGFEPLRVYEKEVTDVASFGIQMSARGSRNNINRTKNTATQSILNFGNGIFYGVTTLC